MYTFTSRGDDSFTLRPEGTAPVVRAAIQHNLLGQGGMLKLYYAGPIFRYERPQKGRYRQFHQIGVEAFGSAGPATRCRDAGLRPRFAGSDRDPATSSWS